MEHLGHVKIEFNLSTFGRLSSSNGNEGIIGSIEGAG